MSAEDRAFYKDIAKKAGAQIWKVQPQSLIDNFGQSEDMDAPMLSLPDGGSIRPLNPKKNTHLLLDAAVWKYWTSYKSPGLTGSGTGAAGKAIRKGTKTDIRRHEEAAATTLGAFSACATKRQAQEFLKEKALEVCCVCVCGLGGVRFGFSTTKSTPLPQH